jgi:hypothetical protein
MSQDINFKPLFDYLDEQFADVNGRLDNLQTGQRILQTSVDSFAKSYKDNTEEIQVINHRVGNQEAWIKQDAPKIGLEYKP